MQEYMETWSHISERKKNGWQMAKLGKSLENAFRTGNKVVRWQILETGTDQPLACFYHTPVTKELQATGGRLGGYLHAMKQGQPTDDPWWDEFHAILRDASAGLRFATTGTLLGPPMRHNYTSQVEMNMEIPLGIDVGQVMKRMENGKFTVDVRYLENLPDPIESEAVVWKQ